METSDPPADDPITHVRYANMPWTPVWNLSVAVVVEDTVICAYRLQSGRTFNKHTQDEWKEQPLEHRDNGGGTTRNGAGEILEASEG